MPAAPLLLAQRVPLIVAPFRLVVALTPLRVNPLFIVKLPVTVPPAATVTAGVISPVPVSVPPVLTVTPPGPFILPLSANVPPLTFTVPDRKVSPQKVNVPVPVLIRLPVPLPAPGQFA